MRWFSRIPTVLAILAALALAAVGVWLSGRGAQPAPAQGEALLVPGDTPLPAATPYPAPSDTWPTHMPPTADPALLATIDAEETARAAWTPTPVPSPTPSPTPLPPLLPGYRTFVYASRHERGTALYRVQVDESGLPVTSPMPLPPLSGPWAFGPSTYVWELEGSPDGVHVALGWSRRESRATVSVVDVRTGASTPLGNRPAVFLAWAPDGQTLAMQEFIPHVDPAVLQIIDIASGARVEVEVPHGYPVPRSVRSASFSPDGAELVISHSYCWECENEIWRLPLDGRPPTLLYRTRSEEIGHVVWSPDGARIAFTQWLPGAAPARLWPGELYVMDATGANLTRLSDCLASIVPGWETRPQWDATGEVIAFLRAEDDPETVLAQDAPQQVRSRVYTVRVETGETAPVGEPGDASVLVPRWVAADTLVYLAQPIGAGAPGYSLWQVPVSQGRPGEARRSEGWAVEVRTERGFPVLAWLGPISKGD